MLYFITTIIKANDISGDADEMTKSGCKACRSGKQRTKQAVPLSAFTLFVDKKRRDTPVHVKDELAGVFMNMRCN